MFRFLALSNRFESSSSSKTISVSHSTLHGRKNIERMIVKCELRIFLSRSKANPHIQRVRCVFNANHLTTPELFLDHVSTCPDAIDRSTVLLGLTKTSKTKRAFHLSTNRRSFLSVFSFVRSTKFFNRSESSDFSRCQRHGRLGRLNIDFDLSFLRLDQRFVFRFKRTFENAKLDENLSFCRTTSLRKISTTSRRKSLEKLVRMFFVFSRSILLIDWILFKVLVVFDKNENDGRDHPVESEDLASVRWKTMIHFHRSVVLEKNWRRFEVSNCWAVRVVGSSVNFHEKKRKTFLFFDFFTFHGRLT